MAAAKVTTTTSHSSSLGKAMALASTGARVSVPLYIPDGRGGLTPPLQLTWSPTAGDGPFGVGWSMEMGSVVRNTKNGVPHYDDTDTFLVNLGGKSYDLVSLGSNNEYRNKFDDDRMRFFFINGVWSAKDRTGTCTKFANRICRVSSTG